jgi:N6-adenosine-specific RNA methylase IME4
MSGPQPDNLPFPAIPAGGPFTFASLDPCWHFNQRAKLVDPAADRSPQKHYPTASIDHLATIPMREIMAPDSLIAMWITGPLLVQGVHQILFPAWGFEPSSIMFVWVKTWNNFAMTTLSGSALLDEDIAMGGGYTTRQNAEYVVLGKRGKAGRARADIRQVIVSNRREHSRKPEEFYRRCEHYIAGPKIDMFGGARRSGWTNWGYGHREGENEAYVQEGFAA